MTDQDKMQKLEIDTVKAVTELKSDIKNLTAMVERLEATLTRMSESYATKEELNVAIRERNQALKVLDEQITIAIKSNSKSKLISSLLWSIFASVMTFAVMYIVEDTTHK